MDFLAKKFNTKEELVDFVREYCYSYGYLTVIRSSSNKRGEIFIICNCSGEEKKSKDKGGEETANISEQHDTFDGRKAKRQKLTKCPFRVNGRRITDEGANSDSYWQITIFNNSHNHLPVVDFTQSTSINVVGNSNRNGLNTNSSMSAYNPDLDIYEQNASQSGGENVVLHSNLFTSQIVKAVNRKLSNLTPQKQTVFLNKFNKLLYEEMPELSESNLQPVIIQNQEHSSNNAPAIHQPPPSVTLPSSNNYAESNSYLGSNLHHAPIPSVDDMPPLLQHQSGVRERSDTEHYSFTHQLTLPTQQYASNDSHQFEFESQSQVPKSRLCKKCGQMGHNSRTCTIHLNTSLLQ